MEEKPLRPGNGEEVSWVELESEISGEEAEGVDASGQEEVDGEDAQEIDPERDLMKQLEESQTQAAEYLEGWQRARAEFANARKRLEKQRSEIQQFAAVNYAQKLLPVLDDFGRAVDAVPEDVETNSWFEGIELVHRKLVSILEELKVEKIEAMDKPFDPNVHEALTLLEVEGVESGIVVEELQIGYRIGDRVIRPSLVNVSA